jgi:hypothetical protein
MMPVHRNSPLAHPWFPTTAPYAKIVPDTYSDTFSPFAYSP